MPKNYYIVLGVSSDSTAADIKAAYRRLAKELHPDYYGKDQTPFQVLQEAYSVLSNQKSRRRYDALLKKKTRVVRPTPQASPRYDQETIEPLAPHEEVFHSQRGLRGESLHNSRLNIDDIFEFPVDTGRYQQTENFPFQRFWLELSLSPEQARRGGHLRLSLPLRTPCPGCFGLGGSKFDFCRHCSGTGFQIADKSLILSYPSGIRDNQSLRFALKASAPEEIHLTVIVRIW